MWRLSAAIEEASTGGITQAARRVLVETMQVGSMEEARQHVAEAASVLDWDKAEAAIMDAAQEVLCVQGVEESMLGTMALDDVWVKVLGAVHGMLVCAAEAERAAEAVREADSVAEAAVDGYPGEGIRTVGIRTQGIRNRWYSKTDGIRTIKNMWYSKYSMLKTIGIFIL